MSNQKDHHEFIFAAEMGYFSKFVNVDSTIGRSIHVHKFISIDYLNSWTFAFLSILIYISQRYQKRDLENISSYFHIE